MRASLPLPLLTLAVLGLAGCQVLAGIETRTLGTSAATTDAGADASIDSPDDGDGEAVDGPVEAGTDADADAKPSEAGVDADAGPPACDPPATGAVGIRFGVLVASDARYDLCVRPSSATTWDGVLPLLAAAHCDQGFGYQEVSIPFGLAKGSYAAKAVPAGAPDCSGSGAETDGVSVRSSGITAVYLIGDDGSSSATSRLVSLNEVKPTAANSTKLRFFHAAPGYGKVDIGVGEQPSMPTKIADGTVVYPGVDFATTAPPGGAAQVIDADGYTDIQIAGGALPFVLAPAGTVDAELLLFRPFAATSTFTMFVTGKATDPRFPRELWAVDETVVPGKLLASTSTAAAVPFKADTYNTQLNGGYQVNATERLHALPAAIASLGSDVICLTELWNDADKDYLAADSTVATAYPYSKYFKHDLSTAYDDPTDATGATPAVVSTPACASSTTKENNALDCVRDNCTTDGTENGVIAANGFAGPSDCLSNNCGTSKLAPLLIGSAADKQCWSCVFTGLASEKTIGQIRSDCVTDTRRPYVFDGASGQLLLSKRPFTDAETWVLPSTEWRTDITRVGMTLSNGAPVDVYCTVLTTPAQGISRPYTGSWGTGGPTGNSAWQTENWLQAKKLAAFVKSRADDRGRRAIVIGEFYAGGAYSVGGTQILSDYNPDAWNVLVSNFGIAAPTSYTPKCTQCGSNPLSPGVADVWSSVVFLRNLNALHAVDASIILDQTSVTVPAADGGTQSSPISNRYGFRSVLSIAS